MNQRVRLLLDQLDQQGTAGLLITSSFNRRYLTGFTGSAGAVLISEVGLLLYTDSRYASQAKEQAPEFETHVTDDFIATAAMHARSFGLAELAVEAAYLTLAQGAALRRQLDGVELVEVTGYVEALRAVKDPAELEILQNAFNVAAEAFLATLPYIRVQMTERDIAARLEFEMRRRGAERVSLETIVASGPRGALPHGRASDRQVQSGELITIDFGCVVKGYCSDVTRTVAAGTPSSQAREIYDVVVQALTAGKAAVRAGAAGQAVDAVARQVIADAGYGDYFVHNLGHSLGLEIHEDPRLARNRPDHILRTGNVVTVEPGIYIPGWGGVRIEDVVTVTDAGSRTLTPLGHELIVV